MTSARDDILGAVDRILADKQLPADAIAREAASLLDAVDEVRPPLPRPSAVESFAERVIGPKVVATLDRVATIAELPGAVRRVLDARGMQLQVALQPTAEFTALDWPGSGLRLSNTVDEGVGVGLARWAVAETGSLVFHSAADTPVLFNFLPNLHIVAVREESIVGHLEDYAAAARAEHDPAPRNLGLITGASGTTDIEGALVRGAHGPRELHIVIVGARAPDQTA
jgi:L-lactate dehydrogenase complex protein LldG